MAVGLIYCVVEDGQKKKRLYLKDIIVVIYSRLRVLNVHKQFAVSQWHLAYKLTLGN